MRKGSFLAAAAVAAALLSFSATARADVLLDTGVPIGGVGGPSLNSAQGLAAEFEVDGATTVTDIYGFIGGDPFVSTFTIALYGDDGGVPGTELHSAQATFDGVEGFHGLSGLSWGVGPGVYWAAFEVRAGDTVYGYMANNGILPHLTNYAFTEDGVWYLDDRTRLGVRVLGDASAGIPEPATWTLMIGGFAFAGAALRRRRAAAAG